MTMSSIQLERKLMKTLKLNDDQFDVLFKFVNEKVERIVDNMEIKDLVRYVTDDMTEWVDKLSPLDFFEEAYNYFDDYFDEIVEEVKGGQFENDLH